jgi:cytochrome c biogenesis protein CcmG, thiol:disulfide interchange protein DsbE
VHEPCRTCPAHRDPRNPMRIILVLVALLAGSGLCAADKQIWAKSVIDQKGPDLVVEKWLTPQPDTKGKFVLIDFWATWCPPCREAIPELDQFAKVFKDQLVVIGISEEPEDKVKAMARPRIEYASAIDTKARMKTALEVKGIPHVILMDPQGIVRWEGFPLLSGHELTQQVIGEIIRKYGKK